MKQLTSIVAVNREGVIGCGNTLPWRLRTDMRFFKEQTTANVVLMGRKTFDSLGRKCLPNRHNIVISHTFGLFPETEDCRPAYGIEDALFRATLAPKRFRETYVIGGASMYEQFSPYVDRYLITMVDKSVPEGDTFFNQEALGDPEHWKVSQLFSCPAGDSDEASFAVFEVLSRYPDAIFTRRMQAVAEARSAAMAGKSQKSKASQARSRTTLSTPSYSMFG